MLKAKMRRTKVVGYGVAGLKSLPRRPSRVKVGLPKGEADNDVIERAIHNEFGTSRIPERPAIRNAVRDYRTQFRADMIKGARSIFRAIAAGKEPSPAALRVLRRLGITLQGRIQEEITSLSSPPNAPSTIAQKGSSNPLIESGEYRNSITYKVET